MYILQLNQMSYNPFTKELQEMYDLGMTDLNSNLRAIDLAKGDLKSALYFLQLFKHEEPIDDPFIMMVQNIIYPQIRTDLELFYK